MSTPNRTQEPTSTLAALLSLRSADPRTRAELRRLARYASIPLAVTGGLLAIWAATAPLSGAIVAAGRLKVELDHKTVQHKEGGIVRSILVRDGDLVQAGQPLLVIGDVRNDAELGLLLDQLAAERIRSARAAAEAALASAFEAPAEPGGSPGSNGRAASEHVARETALFAARRRTLDEQIASLDAQTRDARAQAAALEQQIEATERSAALAAEELAINEKLVQEGFMQRARVLQLEREQSDYLGRLSENRSDLALARQRIGELQARIAQARNHYQQLATDEAKESAARIRELEERLKPFQDQAERQYVRAPAAGRVMGLGVSSAGEVIGPGEPILEIVPTEEKLVVEAHIRPQDVDHVFEGAAAEVRLSVFDARTTPPLPGTVAQVSADRFTSSESGASWYVANVEIDAAELARHPELPLRAGMPAEIFVATPERTLFQYLAKPLSAFAVRAMREP
jgi:HlyD family type I secretion membrane fusion protein